MVQDADLAHDRSRRLSIDCPGQSVDAGSLKASFPVHCFERVMRRQGQED